MPAANELAPDYHAHIYFDAGSRDRAWGLRERISREFTDAEVGRFHEKNVGPHPRWSCQIKFSRDLFSSFVPWLMLNRDGLTIFLHPNTGDDLADHAQFLLWMGEMLPLDLSIFRGEKPAGNT
jgi:aromatic ring-cleaving dioxygenase